MKDWNLKYQALPEPEEGENNLRSFLSSWLGSALNLDHGVVPLIDVAYHLGPPNKCNPGAPKDIITTFPDSHTHSAILQKSRTGTGLTHSGKKILVLFSLSPETLQASKLLKPIKLFVNTMKFCLDLPFWHSTDLPRPAVTGIRP